MARLKLAPRRFLRARTRRARALAASDRWTRAEQAKGGAADPASMTWQKTPCTPTAIRTSTPACSCPANGRKATGHARRRQAPDPTTPEQLHVCFHCAGELVYPLDWAEEGARHWRIVLRCPECESRREGVFEQTAVERLDDELDRATGDCSATCGADPRQHVRTKSSLHPRARRGPDRAAVGLSSRRRLRQPASAVALDDRVRHQIQQRRGRLRAGSPAAPPSPRHDAPARARAPLQRAVAAIRSHSSSA